MTQYERERLASEGFSPVGSHTYFKTFHNRYVVSTFFHHSEWHLRITDKEDTHIPMSKMVMRDRDLNLLLYDMHRYIEMLHVGPAGALEPTS